MVDQTQSGFELIYTPGVRKRLTSTYRMRAELTA